jgi:hypothetical protein
MPDQNILTLRRADQTRTDFALIESNLEFIAGQLAKQPTRGDLAKAALGIIFCTAVCRRPEGVEAALLSPVSHGGEE